MNYLEADPLKKAMSLEINQISNNINQQSLIILNTFILYICIYCINY